VVPECLFCHSGEARPVPNSLNTYRSPPFELQAITCERCHGPAADHLAKPSAATILNPAKLAPERRDAVCEQCHLGGEARILNPGKQFADYRPGESLEDTFSAYVFNRPAAAPAGHALKVVSHVEQLAESACARESQGRMWCSTCHDPHDKPADPVAYYRERCQQCHVAAELESHPKPAQNCIGCHMPRRKTYDGSHTAFSDHQIQRRPAESGDPLHSNSLRPWRQPPDALAMRNLGLAHISVGERDQSVDHLNEGFRLLAEVQSSFNDDPAVLTSLGVVLLKKNVPEDAAKLFRRAATLEPKDARHHLNLASALWAAGKPDLAIEALEKAIALDPSLEDAYLQLAEIIREHGSPQQSRQALERYLEFMPQSLSIRRLLNER
jgi:tetratricopeptide (TPR) repeat protein